MSEAAQAQLPVQCSNCIAYVPIDKTGGQGGECHLNPPAVVVITSDIITAGGSKQHINTVFPPVPAISWCLRFVPHPQKQADANLAATQGIALG